MSKWTVEIRIIDAMYGNRPKEVITRTDDEDTEMILKLCQLQARFEYDGRIASSGPPLVDPVRRTLIYYVELWGEA
jgi:hypothetical protein